MEHLLKDFKSMLTLDYFAPRKIAERLVPDYRGTGRTCRAFGEPQHIGNGFTSQFFWCVLFLSFSGYTNKCH